MRLENKVAIVTGAAGGIGAAIAQTLAREGALVVATDVQLEPVQKLVAGIRTSGGQAIAVQHNVGSEGDWKTVVEQAIQTFGHIDVLVNNAGITDKAGDGGNVADNTPLADWDRVIDINLKGVFLGLRQVIPALVEAGGGSIVNVSSVAAFMGNAGSFAYTASKGGVRSLTKHLAVTYGKKGIRANSVHPGLIETSMTRNSIENPEWVEFMNKAIPLGRVGTPEEIATAVLFLASDDARYVTGVELIVDGGIVIN